MGNPLMHIDAIQPITQSLDGDSQPLEFWRYIKLI